MPLSYINGYKHANLLRKSDQTIGALEVKTPGGKITERL